MTTNWSIKLKVAFRKISIIVPMFLWNSYDLCQSEVAEWLLGALGTQTVRTILMTGLITDQMSQENITEGMSEFWKLTRLIYKTIAYVCLVIILAPRVQVMNIKCIWNLPTLSVRSAVRQHRGFTQDCTDITKNGHCNMNVCRKLSFSWLLEFAC